jgi:hypothetical protein
MSRLSGATSAIYVRKGETVNETCHFEWDLKDFLPCAIVDILGRR